MNEYEACGLVLSGIYGKSGVAEDISVWSVQYLNKTGKTTYLFDLDEDGDTRFNPISSNDWVVVRLNLPRFNIGIYNEEENIQNI